MTIREELIKYSKDCISRKIPSGEKHIWACKRYLKDLKSDFEYYWNEELSKVTTDTTKTKVSQTFGIGSQEKSGITKDNIEKIKANDTATIKSDFSSKMYPLEQRYAQNVNVIGNNFLNRADYTSGNY